jgi:hypothetical protein
MLARMFRHTLTSQPCNALVWNRSPLKLAFPNWMVAALDREAQRLGIQRDAVIKLWLAERLKAITDEP